MNEKSMTINEQSMNNQWENTEKSMKSMNKYMKNL